MQYKLGTDKDEVSVQLNDPEPELQLQLDTPTLQPDENEVPKPTRPGEPPISECEKAMTASAPGSEYWLP